MQKKLKKETLEVYYFDEKGNKIIGLHDKLSGNVSNIIGDVSWIRGNVSNLSGNVSRIRGDVSRLRGYMEWLIGNVTGIRGYVTGIIGNIDECGITDEERKQGINIKDLIKKI